MDEQRVELNSNFHNWKKDLEQVDDIFIIGVRVQSSKPFKKYFKT